MTLRTYLLPAALLAVPIAAMAAGEHLAPTVATSSPDAKMPPSSVTGGVPIFSKVDKNGDGWIEWSEAKAVGVPRRLFKREDYHHDGKLTLTEWQMVRVAMIPTARLPAVGAASLPRVPASVAKAMDVAPATVASAASISAPAAVTSSG